MSEFNQTPGKWKQTMAAIIMCLGGLIIGISAAWTSNIILILQEEENELGMKPLTDDEKSWIVSVTPIGQLTTMLWAPKLCEALGRTKTATVAAMVHIITWLLKLFAINYDILLVAQLLQGIGNGLVSIVVPIYITEATSDAIRGRLASLFVLYVTGGYLFAFILVAVLSYKLMASCTLIIPIIQLGGLLLLPETPMYLIRNNRVTKAQKSLMWLRGQNTTVVESELLELKQLHENITQPESSRSIKNLFTDRVNRKGFIISLTMFFIQEMTGIRIMLMYIVTILNEAKTAVDLHVALIIYASIFLVGCWLSTLTVDRFGRRPLLLLSFSGVGIGHFLLAIFFATRDMNSEVAGYNWLPLIATNLCGLSYSIGIAPLTPVVANEIINPKFASICNSVMLVVMSITAFPLVKTFPLLTSLMGYQNYFYIFVANCVIGFFIVLYIIPETKGKSIKSIREELQKQNNDDTTVV